MAVPKPNHECTKKGVKRFASIFSSLLFGEGLDQSHILLIRGTGTGTVNHQNLFYSVLFGEGLDLSHILLIQGTGTVK